MSRSGCLSGCLFGLGDKLPSPLRALLNSAEWTHSLFSCHLWPQVQQEVQVEMITRSQPRIWATSREMTLLQDLTDKAVNSPVSRRTLAKHCPLYCKPSSSRLSPFVTWTLTGVFAMILDWRETPFYNPNLSMNISRPHNPTDKASSQFRLVEVKTQCICPDAVACRGSQACKVAPWRDLAGVDPFKARVL